MCNDEQKIAEEFDNFIKETLFEEANKIRKEKGYPLVDKEGNEIVDREEK